MVADNSDKSGKDNEQKISKVSFKLLFINPNPMHESAGALSSDPLSSMVDALRIASL